MGNGTDNYTLAAFSFRYAANGDIGQRLCKNHWDLLFGNSPAGIGTEWTRDTFEVDMVKGDCNRIADLGDHDWSDDLVLPELLSPDKPTNEPSIPAIVNHMYLVHTKQWDWDDDPRRTSRRRIYSDYYSLFRVESLDPGQSVRISWRLNSRVKSTPVKQLEPCSDWSKRRP